MGGGAEPRLDDVQVLGEWNFTLQGDTPLYWIRSGALERYLLNFRVCSPCPCTCGLVLHAEADGSGTDGVSFWVERKAGKDGREGTRRYMLAGGGLDSKAIATRAFPDAGGEYCEDIQVFMQGYTGTVLLQGRKVQLRFRTKRGRGSVAFYNSTQGEVDNVHFSSLRITALRRGPLEVGGDLGRREQDLQAAHDKEQDMELETANSMGASLKDLTGDRLPAMSSSSTYTPTALAGRRAVGPGGSSPLGATRWPPPKARLQKNASDGVLRKSFGVSRSAAGDGWLPLATNAPASEQRFLQDISSRRTSRKACNDFIAM